MCEFQKGVRRSDPHGNLFLRMRVTQETEFPVFERPAPVDVLAQMPPDPPQCSPDPVQLIVPNWTLAKFAWFDPPQSSIASIISDYLHQDIVSCRGCLAFTIGDAIQTV